MDQRERDQAYDDNRRHLLDLLTKKAFAKRQVTLSSGKTSDFYIDCKKALTGKGLRHVGEMFFEQIERRFTAWTADFSLKDIVGVGGLTMGADPLAVATVFAAQRRCFFELSPFYIRKEPKKHGTEAWLEGPDFQPGAKVVIVEDVITTGASTIKAIERARVHKLEPMLVLALVDRCEENGRQNIEALHVPVQPLFTRADFPT